MPEHPLRPIVDLWLQKIDYAKQVKEDRFGKYARITNSFYMAGSNWRNSDDGEGTGATGDAGFLSDTAFGSMARPNFVVNINKVFEAVALFGPALFHQYPEVLVDAVKRPEIPAWMLGLDVNSPFGAQMAMQMQSEHAMEYESRRVYAGMKQTYLNWLQVTSGKKEHCRSAITEAVVKGLGTTWCEMFKPPGSQIKYPRSVYRSVDDYLKDPDASYEEDVQWVSLRNVQPVNIAEARFGLAPGTIKGQLMSLHSQSLQGGKTAARSTAMDGRSQGRDSHDLIEYWEVWSKNGFGDRLKVSNQQSLKSQFDFTEFGDYTYIVVARGIPYPLNMPTASLNEDPRSLFLRAQWPIPFWADSGYANGWPVSELAFYRDTNSVWPISLVRPAIPEIEFVNWCMSFLADKVAASCTTYIGVLQDAAEDIRAQLQSPNSPYRVIELARMVGRNINEVVSFIQAPDFQMHIWQMVSEVMQIIDKKTGVTELLHGLSSRQIRSATESEHRQQNIQIRPDDMASRTEDWLSSQAMKEMEAACWMLDGNDVTPILGQLGAEVFERQVQSQPFDAIVRDFDYRIAADSARKPNKAQKIQNLYEFGQVALPVIQQFAMGGLTNPWNAFIEDICGLLGLEAERYMVHLPPPEQQGPTEEEQKLEAKQANNELDLRFKRLEHDLSLLQQEESHNEELSHRIAMNEQELRHAIDQHQAQMQARSQAA